MAGAEARARRRVTPGGEAPKRVVSTRAHLTRAILLVLLIAIVPSIVSIHYLRAVERSPAAPARLEEGASASDPTEFPASERAIRNVITFTLLAIAAGSLVAIYAPSTLLRAIARVRGVLEQAESGNLNVAVASSGVSELSQLAVAVNRTLGRLRYFDELKTARIREERHLVDALLSASRSAVALVDSRAQLVRWNPRLAELAGGKELAQSAVRDIFGREVHEAVRSVQRERNIETIRWCSPLGTAHRATLAPVRDEVDAPPRVILTLDEEIETRPAEESGA